MINGDLGYWVNNYWQVQKLRIATGNRMFDFKKRKLESTEGTIQLSERLSDLEKFLDKQIKKEIKTIPIWISWLKHIKGIGHCLGGQLICEVGTVADEKYIKVIDGDKIGQRKVRACPTISSLWKYAGFSCDEQGNALKKKRGEAVCWNTQLKMICWKIAKSIIKTSGGSFYEQLYRQYKRHYEQKYAGDKDTEKGWKGHQDSRAMRKMIKIFLSHLWIKWREIEGLVVRKPYVNDVLNHKDFIAPPEPHEELAQSSFASQLSH